MPLRGAQEVLTTNVLLGNCTDFKKMVKNNVFLKVENVVEELSPCKRCLTDYY